MKCCWYKQSDGVTQNSLDFLAIRTVVWKVLCVSRVLFVHGTTRVPVPSPFVCLTDWECSCAWAASCGQSFFWKRSMDGGDRCEAAERTIHVQHVKGARSQTRNSQIGIPLQRIVYCNKEHSHQITCSLYTGGNLADTRSLELPQWNPPASWSLPWALHLLSDDHAAAKLSQF